MNQPPRPTISFEPPRGIPVSGRVLVPTPSNTSNAERMAASAAIGVAPVPPDRNIPQIRPQQVLQFLTYVVPLSGAVRINVSGNYFYIHTITGGALTIAAAPLSLRASSSPALVPIDAERLGNVFPADFEWIEISDPLNGGPRTVTLWIGHGYVEDNRQFASQITIGVCDLCTATIARPNNAVPYAAEDAVSTAAGAVSTFNSINLTNAFRAQGSQVTITQAAIIKTSSTVANASFRLHIQSNSILPTGWADNVPYELSFLDSTSMEAIIDFPIFIVFGAGAGVGSMCMVSGLNIPVQHLSGQVLEIQGQLTAQAAYIPTASENFLIKLWFTQTS